MRPITAAYLYNPFSGSGTAASYLDQLQKHAEGLFSITPVPTTREGFRSEISDLCKKNYSCIIIAGGDGTIHAVVDSLMRSQSTASIAIVPTGTGNDLAKALDLFQRFTKNTLQYLQALVRGISFKNSMPCRVLLFNEKKYFINYAGVGVDAAILSGFEKKRGLPIPNRFIYIYSALSRLFTFPQMDTSLFFTERGTRKVRTLSRFKQILILNISSYGGGFIQLPDISLQGDSFRLIVINRLFPGIIDLILRHKIPALTRLFPKKMKPEEIIVSEVVMHFSSSPCLQIDGELVEGTHGNKDMRIKVGGTLNMVRV